MEMTGSRIAVSAQSEMSCTAIAGSSDWRFTRRLTWRRWAHQNPQKAMVTASHPRLQSDSMATENYSRAFFPPRVNDSLQIEINELRRDWPVGAAGFTRFRMDAADAGTKGWRQYRRPQ